MGLRNMKYTIKLIDNIKDELIDYGQVDNKESLYWMIDAMCNQRLHVARDMTRAIDKQRYIGVNFTTDNGEYRRIIVIGE